MPSTKKRVNLTLSDEIYSRLQAYKTKYGITNDATACLQLIVQQLNGIDNSERLFSYMSQVNIDTLTQMSKEGFETFQNAIRNEKANS